MMIWSELGGNTKRDSGNGYFATYCVEGADPTYTDLTATTRLGNYTQISTEYVVVSNTQEAVVSAGRKSEVAYQVKKALKNLALDMEYALVVNSNTAVGASGTARQLKGIVGWISTNNTTGTGTGNEVLTESIRLQWRSAAMH